MCWNFLLHHPLDLHHPLNCPGTVFLVGVCCLVAVVVLLHKTYRHAKCSLLQHVRRSSYTGEAADRKTMKLLKMFVCMYACFFVYAVMRLGSIPSKDHVQEPVLRGNRHQPVVIGNELLNIWMAMSKRRQTRNAGNALLEICKQQIST